MVMVVVMVIISEQCPICHPCNLCMKRAQEEGAPLYETGDIPFHDALPLTGTVLEHLHWFSPLSDSAMWVHEKQSEVTIVESPPSHPKHDF